MTLPDPCRVTTGTQGASIRLCTHTWVCTHVPRLCTHTHAHARGPQPYPPPRQGVVDARGGHDVPRRMSRTSTEVKCLRIKGKGHRTDVGVSEVIAPCGHHAPPSVRSRHALGASPRRRPAVAPSGRVPRPSPSRGPSPPDRGPEGCAPRMGATLRGVYYKYIRIWVIGGNAPYVVTVRPRR